MVNELLVDALIEFLEAAVHTILKSRSIYSPQLFENRRLYGISVSQCRHPDVCIYVATVLSNLRPLLLKDTLQELVVAFFDEAGSATSKVSFIVQAFNCSGSGLVDWSALEPSFRSCLLKLHFSDNLLPPLPPGSKFELLGVATSRAGVNQQVFQEEAVQTICLQEPATGLPLNACKLPGVLSMQIVLEAGPAAPTASTLASDPAPESGAPTVQRPLPAAAAAAAAAAAPRTSQQQQASPAGLTRPQQLHGTATQ